MPKQFVFLDSSVIFSATKSKLGGSFRILEECRAGTFQAVISKRVIREVQINLQEKHPELLSVFYNFLFEVGFQITNPTITLIKKCQEIINPDDAVILAAALKAKVDCLITLDKKHFMDMNVTKKAPIVILTPRDFLSQMRSKGVIN
ncbi:MAG: PIN domain-containing protein [Candidatus Kuenenbacteria bacterium]